MKPKVFSKKLNLNKKTIAHLNNNAMKDVYGGGTTIPKKCYIEVTISCPTNNTDAGGPCCCGGDTTEVAC